MTIYYEFAANELVDCFGKPIESISKITNLHYLLVIILVFILFVQFFIVKVINKYIIKENNEFNQKLENNLEKFSYIITMGITSITFGIPGFYSMLMK